MKTVEIEWMHLDKNGNTCKRCKDTKEEIKKVISYLNVKCASSGIKINFLETKLSESEIKNSNLILINGIPLENIIPNTQVSSNNCTSCREITQKKELCRTIVQHNSIYEVIPQKMIQDAVCKTVKCC